MNIQEKAENLSKTVFLGGPVKHFERVGRLQLIALLRNGLHPYSKVLDIGCGCLRGGYWLIHFLSPDCYFGLEPNKKMLEAGIECFLSPELIEHKRPRFDFNTEFDFSVFGEKMDFFIARSIWTHASKPQIRQMLDSFYDNSSDEAVFLTSYVPVGHKESDDYEGNVWIGRSHESSSKGVISHSFRWIEGQCLQRGLFVKEIEEDNFGKQVWLRIARKSHDSPVEKSANGVLHRKIRRLLSSTLSRSRRS